MPPMPKNKRIPTTMNAAHLHLIVNHFPIVGSLFTLLVLLYGHMRRQPEVLRLGYLLMIIVALSAGVAYLTGEPAEEIVEDIPGVVRGTIHEHEEIAEWGMIVGVIGGVLALVSLASLRVTAIPAGVHMLTLLWLLVTVGLMAYVGNTGGNIRHTEIANTAVRPAKQEAFPGRQGKGEEHEEEERY